MRSISWSIRSGVVSLACIWAITASAAEPAPADVQAAITQAGTLFTAAFARQDAKAISNLFTPEAEYVEVSGVIFHGRAAIEAEYSAAFQSTPRGKIELQLQSIRPIAQGIVIEEGLSRYTANEGGATSLTGYSATHVRQPDGSYLMASVRESEPNSQSPRDRLQALSWLLGSWHEDLDSSVILTQWNWADGENFLISNFTVQRSPTATWTGTHRIGWDPGARAFHSWIFESTGGFVEGLWDQNSDGSWTITLAGMNAGGERVSSILTYALEGPNTIRMTQDQALRGGTQLPTSSHQIVRQAPPPKPAVK